MVTKRIKVLVRNLQKKTKCRREIVWAVPQNCINFSKLPNKGLQRKILPYTGHSLSQSNYPPSHQPHEKNPMQ